MANREKLPIKSNVPMTVKLLFDKPLVGTIKSGENAGEQYTLYAVEHEGVEYSLFGNKALDEDLAPFGKGTIVVITKAEEKNPKTQKVFHTWHANQPIFDNTGTIKPEAPPKPDIVKDETARDSVLNDMKSLYQACLVAAAETIQNYREWHLIRADETMPCVSENDLREIATTYYIALTRRF